MAGRRLPSESDVTCSLVPLCRLHWLWNKLRAFAEAHNTMNEAEQFEAIVSQYYEGLFKFAMSLTRSENEARDLTQHTFCTWANKGHQLRDASKVKTWLFTTLYRAFLAVRRKRSLFPHHELEAVAAELPPAASPEVANQVDSAHILSALSQVDDVYQAALALFYIDDLSYEEIATALDVPVGTVRSRLSRGITQLRRIVLPEDATCETDVIERDGRVIGA
jgi:RNA polymerase sigma factor (sigma-70 family)